MQAWDMVDEVPGGIVNLDAVSFSAQVHTPHSPRNHIRALYEQNRETEEQRVQL